MVSSKRTGKDFEKRVCSTLTKWEVDAEPIPFSGAGKELKGDVHAIMGKHDLFIECKKTRAKHTITIKREDLEKAAKQALPHQLPILVFGYSMSKLYAIIPLEDLQHILVEKEEQNSYI